MSENEQYAELISEIIKKQAIILGPEIAVLKQCAWLLAK